MVEELLVRHLKEYQQNEKAFDEVWKNNQFSEGLNDFLSNKKEAYFSAILTLMKELRELE
jgi:hypothetical protein